ncbi:demethylmenaquinone methyltransferase [Micrococcales bacterium 31B]|nr:demethylmenaquinone methyltransferase [Micrococcales bacterium 31B]
MTRADLDKAPNAVADMFDRVAKRYDIANTVLSLGFDSIWREAVVRATGAAPGVRILDLAAGTGTSSRALADAGAEVAACDFSLGMLTVGRERQPELPFIAGDATTLPFADDTFDSTTISFGLRNVVDMEAALREMLRVTKPGGTLVVCEFSTPTLAPFRLVYSKYLMRAVPAIARVCAKNPAAYEYLAESISAWPDQAQLARLIHASGWRGLEWQNWTGGVVALHRASKA